MRLPPFFPTLDHRGAISRSAKTYGSLPSVVFAAAAARVGRLRPLYTNGRQRRRRRLVPYGWKQLLERDPSFPMHFPSRSFLPPLLSCVCKFEICLEPSGPESQRKPEGSSQPRAAAAANCSKQIVLNQNFVAAVPATTTCTHKRTHTPYQHAGSRKGAPIPTLGQPLAGDTNYYIFCDPGSSRIAIES